MPRSPTRPSAEPDTPAKPLDGPGRVGQDRFGPAQHSRGSPGETALRIRDVAVLLAGALVLIATGIGLRDPWPADEPRFVLIAKEMLESGRWLIPLRAGELYPDKPPLVVWAVATGWLLTGSMRVAFLLPSLLAALGTLLLVYDLGRRLWTRHVGMVAAVLLLFTIQFTNQARSAQLDMALTFWTTLGAYGLLRHMVVGPAPAWFLAGFAAMGLGVITKGVGFLPLLLFVPAGLYVLANGRGRLNHVPWWLWLFGPVVFVAAAGLWGGPMLLEVARSGDADLVAYRNEILFGQTVDRYVAPEGHIRPAWYYLVRVAPWFWLPGTLLLPWALPAWRRRLRRGDARLWLLLGWTVAVLIFFSFSPGKRGVYILPAAPAFVLALAPLVPGLWRRAGPNRLAWSVAIVIGLILTATGLAGLAGVPALAEVEMDYAVRPWSWILSLGAVALIITFAFRPRRGAVALATLLAAFWLLFGLWGYPLLDVGRSPRTFMADVAERTGGNELALANWREQFVLHARQPIVHFGYHARRDEELRAIAAWLRDAPDRLLLAGREDIAGHPCFEPDAGESLGRRHRRQWLLLGPGALRRCAAAGRELKPYRYEPANATVRRSAFWAPP